jgi:hypothetical protein
VRLFGLFAAALVPAGPQIAAAALTQQSEPRPLSDYRGRDRERACAGTLYAMSNLPELPKSTRASWLQAANVLRIPGARLSWANCE